MKIHLNLLFTLILLVLGILNPAHCLASDLPATGNMHKDFASIDKEIQKILQETGHKAATAAITINGYSVFNRAYGYQDKTLSHPLQPNIRMRISIIERCLTSILIRHLIDKKQLKPTTRVFEFLDAKSYHGMIFDPRIRQISLHNILDHKLGWDAANDAWSTEQKRRMEDLFGTEQLSIEQINSYMLTQQLQSDPGTTKLFSEYGQRLLRALITKATGKTYLDYLTAFAKQYGVIIQPSKSVELRDNTEIWYQPETHTRQNAVAISAQDLVGLFDKFWINGEPRHGNGRSYSYFANTTGTIAILGQRKDGINYALLFNSGGNVDIGEIDQRINKHLNSL